MKKSCWRTLVPAFVMAIPAVLGACREAKIPTAAEAPTARGSIKIGRPAGNMIPYWVCQQTVWLSDGTSVIDCFLEYYDDGTGSGEPVDPGQPPIAAPGGGSGGSGGSTNDETWTDEENAFPACPGGICQHVSIATSDTWMGCPLRIDWTDPNGPHGEESWHLKLQATKFDLLALTKVGHYVGTSTINGFSSVAYARDYCDVGWVTFHSSHPG